MFVRTDRVEASLATEARRIQRLREGADYDARQLSADDAAGALSAAHDFVRTIESLLD